MARQNKKQFAHLDFEIEFYEGVLKQKPNFLQALIALGDSYTKRGFFEKGLAIDKRLAALKPDDEVAWYNLACSYSLLKEIDRGLEALSKSISLGYNDFVFMNKDPDLNNLREDSRFKNLMMNFQKR